MTPFAARLKAYLPQLPPAHEREPWQISPCPVATETQLLAAERALGFDLPVNLREIYALVGNGGFGGSYGIMGIAGGHRDDEGHTVETKYAKLSRPDPDDPYWRWPRGLLPICHLGCGMYVCLPSPPGDDRLVCFAGSAHVEGPWNDAFVRTQVSLEKWLDCWMAGESWSDRFMADCEPFVQ